MMDAASSVPQGNDRSARKAAKTAATADGSWDRCMYYMPAKKRYCSVRRISGSMHCGNHLAADHQVAGLERMVCPIDPTHTLFVRDKTKHIKICNVSKRRNEMMSNPSYSSGANYGPVCSEDDQAIAAFRLQFSEARTDDGSSGAGAASRKRPASQILSDIADDDEGDVNDAELPVGLDGSGDHVASSATANAVHRMLESGTLDLQAFSTRIQVLYDAHVGSIPVESPETAAGHALVSAAMASARGVAQRSVRHEAQQASIVGHMQAAGLLPVPVRDDNAHKASPPLLLLEFGAGRGLLSRTVAGFVAHSNETGAAGAGGATAAAASDVCPHSYLLVDRGAVRRKADSFLATGGAAAGDDAAADAAPSAAASPANGATVRLRMDIADLNLCAVDSA